MANKQPKETETKDIEFKEEELTPEQEKEIYQQEICDLAQKVADLEKQLAEKDKPEDTSLFKTKVLDCISRARAKATSALNGTIRNEAIKILDKLLIDIRAL